MQDYLRERGLFAFLREYLERRSVAPHTLLLAFGVMVVSFSSSVYYSALFLSVPAAHRFKHACFRGKQQRPETSLMDQLRMLKIACARV